MMKNQINIAEILKDCPKGTKLYSPLCGECYFDSLNMGTIICKKQNTQEITFTSGGYYMLPVFDDCECQLFPSKDQRDWSKFQRPFKDGDIISNGHYVAIFHKTGKPEHCVSSNVVYYHCWYNNKYTYSNFKAKIDFGIGIIEEYRYATEKEKEKLFKAIKDNGYKWNPETKTLDKLIIKQKFKVGDWVGHHKYGKGDITQIFWIDDEIVYEIRFESLTTYCKANELCKYELLPTKFDITTLKTFDEVLVRHNKNNKWRGSFFSHIDDNLNYHCYKYVTIGGKSYPMCIPHEGNEHLCGTTDDCVEYYENW